MLSSASEKAKLFADFSTNCDVSLPTFSSRTNLKMHNIPVTLKLAKKVIPDLQRSNGSLVVIPVVVLRECEPEHSYTLTELFNMYLKEFYFPDC